MSILTRSGSNAVHGDVFEFLRNDALNARDYFGQKRDSLKRNQFGGSIGAPIIHDRLFIFGNYQGTINHQTLNNKIRFVPNNKMLNGDFSDLLHTSSPVQLVNPSNGQPFSNNMIPVSMFSPVAQALAGSLPRTDDPTGRVVLAGQHSNQDYNEFTTKLDWNPLATQHVSFRSFYDNFNLPAQNGGGDILLAARGWFSKYQNYTVNWVDTLSPNFFNNLVLSYSRSYSHSTSGATNSAGKPICYPCLGSQVTEDTRFAPSFVWSTNEIFILENYAFTNMQMFTLSDSVNWVKGKHLLVAGADVRREYYNNGSAWTNDGQFNFSGQFTGYDLADFLLGDASQFTQGAGTFDKTSGTFWGIYAQDTVRATSNLTLNAGVRWEPFFPPTMSKGEIASFRPGEQSVRYPNAPIGLVYPGDPGVPAATYPNHVAILEPRISLAWQPKMLPNTAVRSAFGMFSVPLQEDYYMNSQQSPPFSPTYNVLPSNVGGPVSLQNPWNNYAPTGSRSPFPPFASPNSPPPSTVMFTSPAFLQGTFAPNFKPGTELTWNLSIEHQFKGDVLARVAYIGSEAYHLTIPVEQNPGFYSTNPATNGQRLLHPNFSSIVEQLSFATASYNGLQLSAEKRFSHGFQVSTNYTWSKNIDTNSGSTSAWFPSVPDPFNPASNRGISDLNYPHIFNADWVYQTPSLANHGKLVKSVFGGWQLSGLWRVQSGTPFSIVGGFGNDNSQAHTFNDRGDVTGLPLDVRQGSQNHWLNQYFNTAAFQPNAPGTFGNSPRNLMQAPPIDNVDLGISKNWKFRESCQIQLRWEMFNAFNRPEFDAPGNDPSSPATFGVVTSTLGASNGSNSGTEQDTFGIAARIMQVALKVSW